MTNRFLFSLFLSISLLPMALQGCTKASMDVSDTIKTGYLALGDSYTIGEAVQQSERFPAQVVQWLNNKGIKQQGPVYIARTGWTTSDLQAAINSTPPGSGYELVSLLIGVNNQYQQKDTGTYRKDFRQLLETAIQTVGNRPERVFVLSIPDYAYTPFGGGAANISKEIDQFNAINKEITLQMGVSYTDITAISRAGLSDPSLVAVDGLHPSAKQYAKWVAELAPKMAAVLK